MNEPIKINLHANQLKSIILSHGWFALKPFEANDECTQLKIIFDTTSSGKGAFEIIGKNDHSELIVIEGNQKSCRAIAMNCLSFDVDLQPFYSLIKSSGRKEWKWIVNKSMGKFLRSPTLFEDCCKAILSTNTTWQRTTYMVNTLVDVLGTKIKNYHAFPIPEKVLSFGEKKLREEIKCGFRAKYLLHLAETAIHDNKTFADDGWMKLSSYEFYDKLSKIKGLGPVSINYLSLLYWKPNGYNIDAYVKRRCLELWNISDGQIEEYLNERYKSLGTTAPVVLWLEITKHWHQPEIFNNEW
jgi:3-methyladenine DNA glycosylase/8-oxoguanine DNA glycosylase